MKRLTKKFEVLFICLLSLELSAQEALITKSKTIEKLFDVGEQAGLTIFNSFGDIQVSQWEDNQIKLVVKMKVIAWEGDDADRFLENLIPEPEVCDCKNGRTTITSSLNMQHIKNFCCPGEKKVYSRWFDKRAEVKHYSVDYEIYVPKSLSVLQLNNAYGNVSMGNFNGRVMINVKNGDLKTGLLELNNEWNSITVKYGKVNISGIRGGKLSFYSCDEIEIGILNQTELNNEFSKLRIVECDNLSLRSKSDHIQIDKAGSINGKSNFSTIHIQTLKNKLELESMSGNITIDAIEPGFEKIQLSGQFNDYHLNLPENNYSIKTDIEFSEFDCPSILYQQQSEDNSHVFFSKKLGDHAFGKAEISLSCSNCKIDLK